MGKLEREWIQINAGLARPDGTALPSARALLREIDAALPEWRRRRLVSHGFFQRKPPDLRLRIRCVRREVMAELDPLLARLAGEGHLRGHVLSVYEPETRQFGGAACMAHVHAFWSRDTANWIARDRLIEAGEPVTPHATLLIAVLNDLFWSTLGDGGEVWDTWCNLLTLLDARPEPGDLAPSLVFTETLMASAGREARLLRLYQTASANLAAGLRDAWARGRMSCGIRTILPHVAMFTLNRHGFDQSAATALARGMAAAWNPKAHLRGAAIDPFRDLCPACAARARVQLLREAG